MRRARAHPIHKYEGLAATYDRRWNRYSVETLSRVASRVNRGGRLQILDVPCGTGELARWLLPRLPDSRLVGVDGSDAMVRTAQAKWRAQPRAAFLRAFAEALPFPEGSFDWLICCSSLHYFRQPEHTLAEFRRVLKPAGRLLMLDWCRNAWHCRLINWWKVRVDPTHVWMYTAEELSALLRRSGFVGERPERFRVPWVGPLELWEMMMVVTTPRRSAAGQ